MRAERGNGAIVVPRARRLRAAPNSEKESAGCRRSWTAGYTATRGLKPFTIEGGEPGRDRGQHRGPIHGSSSLRDRGQRCARQCCGAGDPGKREYNGRGCHRALDGHSLTVLAHANRSARAGAPPARQRLIASATGNSAEDALRDADSSKTSSATLATSAQPARQIRTPVGSQSPGQRLRSRSGGRGRRTVSTADGADDAARRRLSSARSTATARARRRGRAGGGVRAAVEHRTMLAERPPAHPPVPRADLSGEPTPHEQALSMINNAPIHRAAGRSVPGRGAAGAARVRPASASRPRCCGIIRHVQRWTDRSSAEGGGIGRPGRGWSR